MPHCFRNPREREREREREWILVVLPSKEVTPCLNLVFVIVVVSQLAYDILMVNLLYESLNVYP
jgi:hypothetical protein